MSNGKHGNNSHKGLVILIVVILIVAILAVGGFVFRSELSKAFNSAKDTIIGTTTTTTTTVPPTSSANVMGDANCDGYVDIADAVAISAYVADSAKNTLSSQGLINADVQGNENGINANDALAVQQYLANIVTVLPL